MPELLSIERRGEVAVVTLQRPEKRNALSIELRDRAGRRLRRALATTRRRLRRADRRRDRVLLGHGHRPVRRRPARTASAWSRPARSPSRRSATASGPWSPRSTGRRSPAGSRWRCSATCASPPTRRVRLSRAAPGDPAELRRRAGGAAGDGRPGALPHRPHRARPRGAAAGDRPRGRRRATSLPGRSSWPSGSPRCRARRSSRRSAGRCSSAATSGASSSTRRSGCSAAPCSARTTSRTARRR